MHHTTKYKCTGSTKVYFRHTVTFSCQEIYDATPAANDRPGKSHPGNHDAYPTSKNTNTTVKI